MTDAAPAKLRANFPLIQGLRGLAALWVVLFHISKGEYLTGFTARLPAWAGFILFDYGSAGVAVFFVLSGFVICHSLTGTTMDARGLGRFVLRRSVRLDPPYWASMALAVVTGLVFARAKGATFALPSPPVVLAHLTYTQELLRLPEIEVVYWTLTYEIQFYLVLAVAWLLITRLRARGLTPERAWLVVMAPLAALAFVAAALAREWAWHGLFVNYWHGFFLGVLAYEGGVRRRWLPVLIALAVVTLLGAARAPAVFGTPCALTALLLVLAARTGALGRALAGAGWQGLGCISYSLYLVHVPLIALAFGAWGRAAGRGAVADAAGLMLAGGAIVGAAAIFWWAVERPSHALAARLSRRGAEPALAPRP